MRWKASITMLVLLGILVGAAYYGWRTVIDPVTDQATKPSTPPPTQPSCVKRDVFHRGQKFQAKDILVNVYNAGIIDGLAARTLNALERKGFRGGVAANPPGTVFASRVVILTKNPRSPKVKLLERQFKGPVKVEKGPPLAPGIDVVIGTNFKGVDGQAPTTFVLKHDIQSCVRISTPKRSTHRHHSGKKASRANG
ncbi:MAG TPA: LytR C-terminal domain-containing protein [Nocardioidaceae bacterium]|nr:LytR C-terminal domain-containing protein [Nocardioidaceae bacterium]